MDPGYLGSVLPKHFFQFPCLQRANVPCSSCSFCWQSDCCFHSSSTHIIAPQESYSGTWGHCWSGPQPIQLVISLVCFHHVLSVGLQKTWQCPSPSLLELVELEMDQSLTKFRGYQGVAEKNSWSHWLGRAEGQMRSSPCRESCCLKSNMLSLSVHPVHSIKTT